MADIVTFGEAMIRLSPPQFRRLEQAHSLDVQVGGAELNTAVALAQLGRNSAWVSCLTDNPLGRLIRNRAREAGVDTRHIVWTNDHRVGLYFVEFGAAPRASSVVYDRRDSAISQVQPGMFAWADIFRGSRWFHVTGITPALSPQAAVVTHEAVEAARAAGLRVSIDLNYRQKLWTPAEAGRCLRPLLSMCDVLITTEEDAEKVLGLTASDHEALARKLVSEFPIDVAAITVRENPLVWRNRWTALACQSDQVHRARSYEVEIVDRLGAGDSFAAGLIDGLLEGDLPRGLELGVALSALKHSIPGDFAWVSRSEVESLLRGGNLRISR
ncbi:MAG: sugar kinase [Gemmataceae bacterium]|nr:sugar kinase [Gemmataceae bacterium]